MPRRIKAILNLLWRKHGSNLLGCFNDFAELYLRLPSLHRTWLNRIVSMITAEAMIDQLNHDASSQWHDIRCLHVAFNIFSEYCYVFNYVAKSFQHIVQQHG